MPGERLRAYRQAVTIDDVRPDLAELRARTAATLDLARPEAVARRRKTGQRTARENVEDLVDPRSFAEYGASRSRRSTRG